MHVRFGFSDRPGRDILMVGLSFVILNAPFWWMQHDYFLVRPWFNIELVLPLLLMPRFPRIAAVALCVCWFLDLTVSNSATFHFDSSFEFVRSAQFLSQAHLSGFLSWSRALMALPFLAAAVLAWLLMRVGSAGTFPWLACLACAALITMVDIANGSSIVSKRSVHLFEGNPAGSPAFTLIVRSWQSRNQTMLRPLAKMTSATEIADIEGWARSHPDGNAVLMVVESMGWHQDPRMRRWLLDQVASPAMRQRFDIQESQVRFTEATTSAELRELCGLRGSYRNITSANGAGCLPSRLSVLGWETAGYHGFSGRMFDRGTWWRLAGIRESLFAENLFRPGDRRCGGGFPGLCDADVVDRALAHAGQPRTLTYILTLNSHLPLTPLPIPPDLALLCKQAGATDAVCLITATIGQALAAIRPRLEDARVDPPLVAIVGDHAPPFSDLASRGEYAEVVVPLFVLRPIDPVHGAH